METMHEWLILRNSSPASMQSQNMCSLSLQIKNPLSGSEAMKVDLPFLITTLVFLHASGTAYSTDTNCLTSSESNACENNGNDCIDKMERVIYYKSRCRMTYPTMYKGRREDFQFNISMTSPSDNKFLIVIQNTTTKKFGIVENCCGVKESESCLLRPKRNGEIFYLIYLNGDHKSCYKHIQEQRRSVSWCDAEKSKRPCLKLENGEPILYEVYDDTSTATYGKKTTVHYCFFEVPVSLVAESDDIVDEILHRVERFHLHASTFRVTGANVTCQKNNSKQINLKKYWKYHEEKLSDGHTVCFFTKPSKESWSELPSCFQRSDEELPFDTPSVVTIGVTIGCVAGISVFILLVLVALYEYRRLFPSFQQTEKEIPKLMRNADAKETLPEDQQRNNFDEIPCEIVCEDEIPVNLENDRQSDTNDEKNEEIALLLAAESQEYVGCEEAQATNSANSPPSILQNSSETFIRKVMEVEDPQHPDDHLRDDSFSVSKGFQELSPFLANDIECRFSSDGQGYVRKEMDAGFERYTKKSMLSQNGYIEDTTTLLGEITAALESRSIREPGAHEG